jgi:hypothetical protein
MDINAEKAHVAFMCRVKVQCCLLKDAPDTSFHGGECSDFVTLNDGPEYGGSRFLRNVNISFKDNNQKTNWDENMKKIFSL